MSDERRPPGAPPPGGAPPEFPAPETGPAGDTPAGGTPAFDELDAHVRVKDSVPPAAAGPDHAHEYVAPRPLPKPADHRTIEDIPVKVAPQADPRNMKTQKAMYVLKREEAEKALAEMGIAPTPPATAPVAPTAPQPQPEPKRSRAWLGILIAVLLLAGLIAFVIQYWLGSLAHEAPPSTTAIATATPQSFPPPNPAPQPAATPTATVASTATPPKVQSEEPTTQPEPEPEPEPESAPKTKPKKDEPRPINE